jgi:hypothetical protein
VIFCKAVRANVQKETEFGRFLQTAPLLFITCQGIDGGTAGRELKVIAELVDKFTAKPIKVLAGDAMFPAPTPGRHRAVCRGSPP